MTKLINAYREAPTLKNACAIRAYDRKHPMSVCTLSPDEMNILRIAIALADAKL